MTTRMFRGGMADLMGYRVNGLLVGDLVGRNPIRWSTTCEICGTTSASKHESLLSGAARCLSSGCGKQNLRENLTDTPQRYAAREAAKQMAQNRESEEAQAAEVAALEAQATESHRKIRALVRERIEKIQDDEFVIDPATVGMAMSLEDAQKFNAEQVARFVDSNPDYYPCQENLDVIVGYLQRNKVQIASQLTVEAAYERLKEYGLLRERPAPEPEVKRAERLSYTPTPAPRVKEVSKPDSSSEMLTGIDPLTGMSREFTSHEVDLMSAAEYKKCFKVGNIADILVRR